MTADWSLLRSSATIVRGDRVSRPEGVLSKLQQTDHFEARLTTAKGEALMATWQVAGLAEALQPVLAACREP